MDNGRELISALLQVSKEKGIDKEVIFEAIEASLVSACKKHFGPTANVRVVVDRETGEYEALATKIISEEVVDDICEISLADARALNAHYEMGDAVEVKIRPGSFGRISAQTAKQVVVQKFREAEREILYNEYIDKESKVVTGIVQRRDRRSVILNLGNIEAYLPIVEQIPREDYVFNERMKVYVLEVKQSNKGPVINVSRTHPELLRHLFEQEVPEISEGAVEIKAVSREAGIRSKVAVATNDSNIDAIGACVGQNGQRVITISNELRGEKIDIIPWSEDPEKYIAAALGPSKVTAVAVITKDQIARVVVPDNQLSLAIGKEGQNARLAARLTGWKIDIKSESQAEGTDFLEVENEEDAALEAQYANFYEDSNTEEAEAEAVVEETITPEPAVEEPIIEAVETEPEAESIAEPTEPAPEVAPAEYADEYYDDEYYDDEYYDDEYYDDEYYDEYYDENYDATTAETAETTEATEPEPEGDK